MKRLVFLMILTALVAMGPPGRVPMVQAQITCIGHERQIGRGVVGTIGDDFIDCNGSSADLIIMGLGGDDFIIGGDGNDMIMAGAGDDWVFARDGDNIVRGGEGNDALFSGEGADWVRGGPGNDVLFGGAGEAKQTALTGTQMRRKAE